jgi:predicted nucleic acid-binding protein
VNSPGVLLDTGPIVALLSKDDSAHVQAKQLFSECTAPFRCCEAVIAEACFLMKKVHVDGPAEVISLGRKGFYEVSLALTENWSSIEALLRKYRNRPISLADACLIRCAEIYREPRILTFDADFRIYRWGRNRTFDILIT